MCFIHNNNEELEPLGTNSSRKCGRSQSNLSLDQSQVKQESGRVFLSSNRMYASLEMSRRAQNGQTSLFIASMKKKLAAMCFWWIGCRITENSGDHQRKDIDIERLYSNGHIAAGMLHSLVPIWDNIGEIRWLHRAGNVVLSRIGEENILYNNTICRSLFGQLTSRTNACYNLLDLGMILGHSSAFGYMF